MEAIRGRSVSAAPGAALGAGLVTVFLVLVAWPLIALLSPATQGDAIGIGGVLGSLAADVVRALVPTVVTVTLAATLAYIVTRGGGPTVRLLFALLLFVLVTPPYTSALAVRVVMDRIDTVGWAGTVWIAQVLTFFPLAFGVMANALARIDPEQEDAAVSLGATAAGARIRVLPTQVRRATVCAALVVFAFAVGDVVNPLVVGPVEPGYLSTVVIDAARSGELATAARAGVALAAPCLIAWTTALCLAGADRHGLPIQIARPPDAGRPITGLASLSVVIAGIAVLAPFALMPVTWLGIGVPVPLSEVVRVIAGSVRLALAVGLVGTALAFGVAVAVVRSGVQATRGVFWLAVAAGGVPGVTLGLGYVVAFDGWSGGIPLWMPVAALALWKIPTAVALLTRRLRALEPAFGEAGVSLGAGNVTVARRIVAPLLAPALAAVFLDLVVQALTSASLFPLVTADMSASVKGLTRVTSDVTGSAALITGLGIVTGFLVLLRVRLAPGEPVALLPA